MSMRFDAERWERRERPARDGAMARAAGLVLLMGIATAACVGNRAEVPAADGGTMAPSGKLSPELRVQAGAPGRGSIAVLVRTTGPVDESERRELRTAGVEVQAVAGDIVSGRVAKESLERLAALPFVLYVEPGRTLRPEREQRR